MTEPRQLTVETVAQVFDVPVDLIEPRRKVCSGCKSDLPASAFHRRSWVGRDGLRRHGLAPRCRTCRHLDAMAHRYGLTEDDVHRMAAAQGGRCAICRAHGGAKRLGVDHDHETGEVRGLLCDPCNLGLGKLQDSELLLRRAADYLRRHAPLPDEV